MGKSGHRRGDAGGHGLIGGEGFDGRAAAQAVPPLEEDRTEPTDRLVSLGKLAARVAHELNGSLDGVLRFVNLSLRRARECDDPQMISYLDPCRGGLLRMAEMVTDLLAYTRGAAPPAGDLALHEVIEEAVRAHSAAADAARVAIVVDLQASARPLVAGTRLLQVCGNLIRNAIDAMPQGGRLTITCGRVGDRIVLRFADTGVGLPDPIERVFEPFYSTKAPGKGTGLGLAVSRDFVLGMGGTITAERGSEGGAVFTVCFPADRP